MTARRHFLSWKEFYNDVCHLAQILQSSSEAWQGMAVITRGGLVPGAILSHQLNIRNIDTICMASYNDNDLRSEVTTLKAISGDGMGWLVIDDLVDSGMTSKVVRQMLPKAYFVAVYAKPLGRAIVDRFSKEVSQDTWLVFPWESSEDAGASTSCALP